ncbi:hypothetical protein [Shimia biformata]|uniref:hypothetical protein n=1 Tax=Shimia biformata TaxID=1294299 RepID=UPI00195101CA|nr:hypothetical protein [Shimia biformata]
MLIFFALVLMLMSMIGLVVSLSRLDRYLPAWSDLPERLQDPLGLLETLQKIPGDGLLLVAAFLIASAVSLGAFARATSAGRVKSLSQRGNAWQV